VGLRLDHYYDRPWRTDEARDGQLVVIGLTGFDRARAEAILKG
jgi:cobalamin biosynthesis protein CobW